MRNFIKDSQGKFIGTVTADASGRTIVRDFKGQIVSSYNPHTNNTQDWTVNKTTQGNVALLKLKDS
jgi:hypothetical protein